MIRAAVTGAIDFQRADPLNPGWWRKIKWVLAEMARQTALDVNRTEFARTCAFISHGNLLPESYTAQQEDAKIAVDAIRKNLQPWVKELSAADKVDLATAQYAANFSDMNSPEHKLAEAKLLAWFENNLRNPPAFAGGT